MDHLIDFHPFWYFCFDASYRTHGIWYDKYVSAFVPTAFTGVCAFLSLGDGITYIGLWIYV
ncbi:hypothetical protein ACFLRS_01895 [Campylobacterota bacterium]